MNAGIGGNVAPRVNAGIGANVAPRVNAGVPGIGANVAPRVNPGIGANVVPRVNAAVPGIGANVAPRVNAGIGANVAPRVNAAIPGVGGNAGLGANAGANARTALRPVVPGGDIRANVNSALNPGVRANVPGVTNARVGANAGVNGQARLNGFLNPGVGVNSRLGVNGGLGNYNPRSTWFNSNLHGNSRLNANLGRTLAGVIGVNAGLNNNVGANLGVGRNNYWGRYGLGVNNYWRGNNRYPFFNNGWYAGRSIFRPYGYFNYFGYRPWGYWWGSPGWGGVNSFYGGYGGYGNWGSPYYYDYGPGGNVVYQDNSVYVDGTNVGTAEEYAQSAAALAAIDPNDVPSQNTEDWLGLGTFAVIEHAGDADKRETMEPTRFVQLAIDKKGFIAGTYYKKQTDETFAVSGRVDKNTQRVAFAFDTNQNIVFETGLYNLTQDQTPVLVHMGPNKNDTFVFVRLEKPADQGPGEGKVEQLP